VGVLEGVACLGLGQYCAAGGCKLEIDKQKGGYEWMEDNPFLGLNEDSRAVLFGHEQLAAIE